VAIEVGVTRVHAHPAIMMDRLPHRIDPDKWRPPIMSFQQFYGLTPKRLQRSELGQNSGEPLQAIGLAAGGLIPVLPRNGNASRNAKQTIRPYTVRR
jgi:hypothetical protein